MLCSAYCIWCFFFLSLLSLSTWCSNFSICFSSSFILVSSGLNRRFSCVFWLCVEICVVLSFQVPLTLLFIFRFVTQACWLNQVHGCVLFHSSLLSLWLQPWAHSCVSIPASSPMDFNHRIMFPSLNKFSGDFFWVVYMMTIWDTMTGGVARRLFKGVLLIFLFTILWCMGFLCFGISL